MKEKIKSFFERYGSANVVYENGGKLFLNKGSADSYGVSTTKEYKRADVEKLDNANPKNKASQNGKTTENTDVIGNENIAGNGDNNTNPQT